ncbi:non-ribosomal peptide synthetase [Streptomyces lunaelactis]|uniref:non-ribosomal peptide synthetase n=1 Tax=Streptomyces lunaelactis TaxID=1535768 RepID=UPI0020C7DEC6|nr:non-ribosomal peptide synthetase [Streptomyces lunaelactis]
MEFVSADTSAHQLAFWRHALAGVEPLEFPTDRPRPIAHPGASDAISFTVPAVTAEGLRTLASMHRASLFMAGLAGLQAVLSRWSRQDDIAVGTPVVTRSGEEFVNTLVMRSDLSSNPSFDTLLGQVRETALSAYAHQDLPFERIVEDLAPARDLSRNALFQVMFELHEGTLGAVDGVRLLGADSCDLSLTLTQGADDGFAGEIVYASELFDRATVERLAGHYANLLSAAVAEPARPVGELDLLGVQEREQLLVTFNDTTVPYVDNTTVQALVEEQVERTPDAPAVVFGVSELSYGELNARANQLAHHLIDRGIKAEDLVTVCVDRGPDMIVALLGVMKAGAAYVPLDPDYPAARLEFMLNDTRAPLVITQAHLADRLPETAAQLLIDADWATVATQPGTNPAPQSGPQDLAYIIYTSGSTGTPKGVMVQHQAICRLIDNNWFADITATDVVAQTCNFCFDVFTFECWGALTAGATLAIVTKEALVDTPLLASTLRDYNVSTMWLTAPLFNHHVSECPDLVAGMKTVMYGGDAVERSVADALLAGPFAPKNLVNGYGPTEATVFATCYVVDPDGPQITSMPIGKPIANTEALVMDRFGGLAPVGVPGELWVGGPGVACGYWNRPELTAERFVPHPFAGNPAEKAYRTGDLVRWLPDGDIEFLGRIDQQVKLRGLRIELGEIEAALAAHEDVANVTVVVREGTPGDKYLVGYCVPAAGRELTAAGLRSRLRESLPDYMVPSWFVFLDALPLTPNGKVDRRALPEPDGACQGSDGEYVAPRNETERIIADIWREVLGLDQVGVHDDFFHLGGHSLHAVQMVSRVARKLNGELTVRDMFNAPTIALLAEVLASGESGAVMPLVPRNDCSTVLPLSFAQQRLWFLDQLEPGSAEYVIPFGFEVKGALDLAALETAFSGLVARHEVLRTRFVTGADGEPVQIVDGPWQVKAEIADLARVADPVEREAAAREVLDVKAGEAFDLTSGRLLRTAVVRLEERRHLLMVAIHHIVADGWSVSVLADELRELYAAAIENREADLPSLVVQYGDFALWQRQWLTPDSEERQLDYWRQNLAGVEALELPADRPRPSVRSGAGDAVIFTIPTTTAEGLRKLASQQSASLFMAGLAGFQAVLSRWSRQDDIAVGTPIAGRNRAEVEDLVGFFVNTLVMRSDLASNPSFEALLGQVRETALGAYAHQDLPFERIVEDLAPERDLSRNALFQVMFALQNVPDGTWTLPGLTLDTIEVATHASKFDLTLFLTEQSDGSLEAEIVYSTELFDRTTVQRLAGHYANLLGAAIADPARPVGELDLLSEQEREELLVGFNDTTVPYHDAVTVHELFEQQTDRTPDTVALTCEGTQISYGELNARANQLAHHLIDRGIKAEDLVTVCVDRGPDMIVALLGVMKAGAAYVPLDPDYPAARLEFMLNDTRAPLVITQAHLADRLPETAAQLLIDADWATVATQPGTNPAPQSGPQDLAYIIYTSGSTGTPKGVMVQHQAICRLIDNNWFADITATDVVAQSANFAFDAFTLECWGALTAGAALAILQKETVLDPERLRSEIRSQSISTMWLTAPLFNQHVSECPDLLAGMKTVLYGGDAVERSVADNLMAGPFAPENLVNGYGPTETTVFATCYLVDPDGPQITSMPIGKPIANTEAFVMDRFGGLAPVGVPGELWIGGPGVAHGYWNRPELTAERFVSYPFSSDSGEKAYRTGDLVRWLPDGNIEFLGRVDQQVKLRGLRIELGEIEAALAAHEDIANVTVVVREDTPGDKRLVGYCVPAAGSELSIADLRTRLRESLPDYMIPNWFVFLAGLPFTPNGKVDRRALPEPDGARQAADRNYTAPRTENERVIADIWSDVLGIDQVGIHDDFFQLGGHSLLATRLISRINKALGTTATVRQLFEARTVAALAADPVSGAQQETAIGPRPAGVAVVPLSFAQRRLWFLDQLEPGSAEYVIPFGFEVKGVLDVAALEAAFSGLVARHEVLRTRFVTGADGEPVQAIDEPWQVRSELIDLRHIADQTERETLARATLDANACRPFDLTSGRLLRATLVQLADGHHLLMVAIHHIVADGWSVSVLTDELREFYTAAVESRPAVLGELGIQYGDFAFWQHGWLTPEREERQLGYWRQNLAGVEPLELPTDRPRPLARSGAGDAVTFTLDADVALGLQKIASAQGASLFMAGLAGFQAVLSRWSRQDDIAVGTPIAGRNRAEVEDLVGFFVNTLVMRSDLASNPSFEALLGQVRETALGAYAHQDLPFERIVEDLAPERDLSRNALFQVMFALQNVPDGNWTLPGLTLDTIEVRGETPNFDLVCLLDADEASGSVEGRILFSPELFDRATVQRLASHYVQLLNAAVADPARPVGELDMLTGREQEQLLVDFNGTAVPYQDAITVHELFEQQTARTPDAIAILCEDTELTYAELNARANQLAHHLMGRGIGVEDLVTVCVDRGPDMIVALLGVMKAGAAYVPLDPDYPASRLEFMLNDTRAPLVITKAHLADRLPETAAQLLIDTDWETVATQPDTNPTPQSGPDNLAYIIYTSGSTGTPKGVMIQHQGAVSMAEHLPRDLRLDSDSRVLQFASPSFDASMYEVFTTWGAGATLVLAPRENLFPGKPLETTVARHAVTAITMSPSLLSSVSTEALEGVRTIVVAGEACPPDTLATWSPGRVFINAYGPSEDTVCSTLYEYTHSRDRVLIGSPIANTEVFVMDRFGGLAPMGVPGELWIGGEGVARGYWNRPELTEERFVPHPFSDNPDARVYRTGDLVRWLPEGNLEFLGRIDQQVKLRGLRIELGEIEAALSTHEDVAAATVIVREDTPGDKRLVGYCVPAAGRELTVADLRARLRTSLPNYMIPNWFVFLDTLPSTPNGKIDRKALPEPEGRPDMDGEYVAPRTETERIIADVWSEVLGLDRIGVHDDFFQLGGHSLRAVRLATRLQDAGYALSVRAVMQHPTVAEAAALLSQSGTISRSLAFELATQKPGSRDEQAGPEGAGRYLFCIHPSGGSAHWFATLAGQLAGTYRTYGIQAPGMEPDEEPVVGVEALAARYWEEIRAVQPQGPYHLLGWSLGAVIAHEMARQAPEETEHVYLVEPPVVEPRVRQRLMGYVADYRHAVALWEKGRQETGAERERTEMALRNLAGNLEVPDESASLDEWLPYATLGGLLESVAAYEPSASSAACTLVISDEVLLSGHGSNASDGTYEEYTAHWSNLYPVGLRQAETPGTHLDMLTAPEAVQVLAQTIISGSMQNARWQA